MKAKVDRSRLPAFPVVFLALAFVTGQCLCSEPGKKALRSEFFNDPKVRVFQFEIPEMGLRSLGRRQQTYVKATVRESGQVFTNVGIRLKGMGSFRSIHEKASFAVKFDEFVEDQEYY